MLMPSASVQSGQFQCSATQQAGCLGLFVIPFPSQKCIHYERYQLFVIPTERSFFRALIHLTRHILGNVRLSVNQSDIRLLTLFPKQGRSEVTRLDYELIN